MVLDSPPLRGDALHQRIQDRITRFIIERGFRPGDPLPAEADLARTLGISRPSLREAMKALQTLGVIEARHGSGTYVGRFSLDPLVDGLAFRIRIDLNQNVQTIRELLEIRLVLESSLVARVAAVRTPEQIAQLEALVARMERRGAVGEEFPEDDRVFHEVLYRPLGNSLVVTLLQAFWRVLARVRTDLNLSPADPAVTAADHRRILDAIVAGDGAAASEAMTIHFNGIQSRIQEPVPGGRTTS
jgi:DNA-binding FadR family transcriptional regulator